MYRTLALVLAAVTMVVTAEPWLEILNSPRVERFTSTLKESAQPIPLVGSCDSNQSLCSQEPSCNSAEALLELISFTGTDGIAFATALVMFSMRPIVRLLFGMKASQQTLH
mmetsp:Transcript_28266/g.45492  ORF Transcript_28266/g.45492 Transcript_28266/m.45492 type:complete len:111 (+) Transcript_28266:156-488(+)